MKGQMKQILDTAAPVYNIQIINLPESVNDVPACASGSRLKYCVKLIPIKERIIGAANKNMDKSIEIKLFLLTDDMSKTIAVLLMIANNLSPNKIAVYPHIGNQPGKTENIGILAIEAFHWFNP